MCVFVYYIVYYIKYHFNLILHIFFATNIWCIADTYWAVSEMHYFLTFFISNFFIEV